MQMMTIFMVVHRSPVLSWDEIEADWARISENEEAKWVRTYLNRPNGVQYCVWLSTDELTLKRILAELDINWDTFMPVEKVVPAVWGKKWNGLFAKEEVSDAMPVP